MKQVTSSTLFLVVLAASACVRPSAVAEAPEPVVEAAATPATIPAVLPVDFEYFEEHPLMVPVDGVEPDQLRDSFNAPRAGGRIHRATDILAPRLTPVLAATAGEVVKMKENAAGGITVYLIDEPRRYVYYYAHLEQYSDDLTEGQKVPQGFLLGYVGTSGNAPPNTPHLHFQATRLRDGQRDWWNGTPVDVRAFMKKKGRIAE